MARRRSTNRRRRFGDSELFPEPTRQSRDILSEFHHKYLKQFSELQRDGKRLCIAAEQEPNPGARARMQNLCKTMTSGSTSGHETAQQIQYSARKIYDTRY